MNILHSILKNIIHDNRYCIGCHQKLLKEYFTIYDNTAGICNDCFSKLNFTQPGSSFDAKNPILYLLSVFEYNGIIRSILKDFKFRADFKIGDILNIMVIDFLKNYPHLKNYDIIVPVPLSKQRLLERGYNQSEIIAANISKYLNIPADNNILIRIRHTLRQSSLNTAQRISNVENAFKAIKSIKSKKIIIVDDIYTTGSTMLNCANELKNAGASEIVGFTIAKSMENRFAKLF